MTFERHQDGTLPAYAWPGVYPLYYLTQDGGILCPACANRQNGSEASTEPGDPQWFIVRQDVYWEGPPLDCDHCGAKIESAYGDPEDDDA